MSLKAFHLIFVNALSALCFGLGAWQFNDYRKPEGAALDLIFGIAGVLAGVAVIVYGIYFLKKLKSVSYL